jgi:hypothetical protein
VLCLANRTKQLIIAEIAFRAALHAFSIIIRIIEKKTKSFLTNRTAIFSAIFAILISTKKTVIINIIEESDLRRAGGDAGVVVENERRIAAGAFLSRARAEAMLAALVAGLTNIRC